MFWLLSSFLFGMVSFLTEITSELADDDNSWSFGQVMPVLLLVVPFITIVEALYSDESSTRISRVDEATEDAPSSPLLPWLDARHDEDHDPWDFHPGRDYYIGSSCMKAGTLLIIGVESIIACYATVLTGLSLFPVSYLQDFAMIILLMTLFSLWCIIIHSLGIDWLVSQEAVNRYVSKRRLLVLLQTVNFCVFAGLAGSSVGISTIVLMR